MYMYSVNAVLDIYLYSLFHFIFVKHIPFTGQETEPWRDLVVYLNWNESDQAL